MAEGTDFRQFNVLNPVCSPSRAAALTGMYPARFSIHQHFSPGKNRERGMPDWLDPKAPNLARIFHEAGYRTGHFGKWHLSTHDVPDAPTVASYGFDDNGVFPFAAYSSTASNAERFIRDNRERPFYLNVWIHQSHTPHYPSAASMEKWKHLGEKERIYAAVITDGDATVGQVLDALKEHGLDENTLVIFSSDNGPEVNGPENRRKQGKGWGTWASVGQTGGLRGQKRSLFEGGVRVPFIVRWPGRVPAGKSNESTVITAVDLLPTLCAAAGIALPTGYESDGENMLPALLGEPSRRTRPVFWEWRGTETEPHWWPRLAVRDGEWKLYLNADGSRAELYRLPDDHAENTNLATSYPEVVARLQASLLAWKASLPTEPDPTCLTHLP
jgi:N-acetylgalactosamine-6-sulfatase